MVGRRTKAPLASKIILPQSTTLSPSPNPIKENPVILLNLITRDTGTVDPYILQSAMLEISDAEWEAFAEENGIRQEPIYKTNAWENYLNQWNVKKGSIVFSAALIVCMFLMEGILLYQILKYEFYVRGRELLLEKTARLLIHPALPGTSDADPGLHSGRRRSRVRVQLFSLSGTARGHGCRGSRSSAGGDCSDPVSDPKAGT